MSPATNMVFPQELMATKCTRKAVSTSDLYTPSLFCGFNIAVELYALEVKIVDRPKLIACYLEIN